MRVCWGVAGAGAAGPPRGHQLRQGGRKGCVARPLPYGHGVLTAVSLVGADEQAALWESVSTVSCRISDMQKFIDDLR